MKINGNANAIRQQVFVKAISQMTVPFCQQMAAHHSSGALSFGICSGLTYSPVSPVVCNEGASSVTQFRCHGFMEGACFDVESPSQLMIQRDREISTKFDVGKVLPMFPEPIHNLSVVLTGVLHAEV